MERHVIIGTAGHIDHGKTTLIKALTGRDTDRLKEEKARGITIDLGFTWMDLTDGERVGIIDVPGHEKFISNMTAGVVGMDLVLLVIAADEGVMPQTREHLAILRLLGVENILVVLNKCDLVDEEWLEMVEQQICEEMQQLLTVGQRNDQVEDKLEYNVDIVRVSAKSGAGIEELRSQILKCVKKQKEIIFEDELEEKRIADNYVFIMKNLISALHKKEAFTLEEFNLSMKNMYSENVLKNADYFSFFVNLCQKKKHITGGADMDSESFMDDILKKYFENEAPVVFSIDEGNGKMLELMDGCEVSDVTFHREDYSN